MADNLIKKAPPVFLVLSFMLLGGMIFSGNFIVRKFLQERTSYQSLRAQIDDIQQKREQLIVAQSSAQNARVDMATIKQSFVDENDVLGVLVPLERKAAVLGISNYKVTVAQDVSSSSAVKGSAVLQGTTLRLEGEGTLQSLFALVQTLQSLPYFSWIESSQIQQAGATPSSSLQIIIIVKFYSLP